MTFEFYKDRAGEYRWRLKSTNGRIVADSGEGYVDQPGAVRAAESVRDGLRASVTFQIED